MVFVLELLLYSLSFCFLLGESYLFGFGQWVWHLLRKHSATVLATFLISASRWLTQNISFREEEFFLSHSLRVQSLMVLDASV